MLLREPGRTAFLRTQCEQLSFLQPEQHDHALALIARQSNETSSSSDFSWLPGPPSERGHAPSPLTETEKRRVAELLSHPSSGSRPLENVFKYPPLPKDHARFIRLCGGPATHPLVCLESHPLVTPAIHRRVVLLGPDKPAERHLLQANDVGSLNGTSGIGAQSLRVSQTIVGILNQLNVKKLCMAEKNEPYPELV
ncbi:hypothetical protein VTJ04DRAFT_4063 [Mycothermus thermophilus]|uniref:uncharacterized protein n=1 Tax=Humicola insolens TaxID=85995 RepID=UPI0037440C4B